MRIVHFLTASTLALAAPALAQAPGREPMPQTAPTTAPAATPVTPPTTGPMQAAPATTATQAAPAGTVTAPAPVTPAVGVKVFDPSGAEVGTIKALDAQYATIATAKGDVKLPAAGVGPGANGAAVGLTAAQIDAAVAQSAAAAPPAAATTETKTTTKTKTKKR